MKAIIHKELRELAPAAALATLAFAAAFSWGIHIHEGRDAWEPTLFTTAMGFPILGAILGLLQTLPEKKRDRWAYLLHRPMPRQNILYAKVVAGLALYLVVTLIPSVFALLWLATPGNARMIFYPPMTYPVFA
ncbi:MAG: hypothetical protein ACYTGQ_04340, partial [Planctomycetota bacterium]